MKIPEWISLHLFPDYLVPRVLGIQRQQVCVELKHLGSSGFALVLGSLFCKSGLVVEGLVIVAKFWGWCVGQSRAFLGLLGSLLLLRGFLCRLLLRSLLGSFLSLASGSREKGQSCLHLLCHLALLYISLAGFLVGLEGALFLDCIED